MSKFQTCGPCSWLKNKFCLYQNWLWFFAKFPFLSLKGTQAWNHEHSFQSGHSWYKFKSYETIQRYKLMSDYISFYCSQLDFLITFDHNEVLSFEKYKKMRKKSSRRCTVITLNETIHIGKQKTYLLCYAILSFFLL